MKAGIFYTESGSILALTTHSFFAHHKLVEKLAEKGITKFIAYEVPIEKVKEKYGKQNCMKGKSNSDGDLRIIDDNERQIFKNFSIKDFSEPSKEKIDASVCGTWSWKDDSESSFVHIGIDKIPNSL